ncbi:MAG: hypothetical protein ACKV19_06640 [Verrucomicrobiales bacterium]
MIPCPACALPLAPGARGVEEIVFCAGCRRDVRVVGWAALDRVVGAAAAPVPVASGEAACFSCADRAATGVCDGCGCYTCPACEARWFGESLCLQCLHARRELQAAPRFRSRAMIHDNIALALLVLPMVFIPVYGVFIAVLLSPISLFLIIRHRRSSRGLPPRGPFRLILAGTVAVLLLLATLAGIGAVGVAIVNETRSVNRAEHPGMLGDFGEEGQPVVVDPTDSSGSSAADGEGAGTQEDPSDQ